MNPEDLKDEFESSAMELHLGPGSLESVKARGHQRTQRARAAVAGTAAAVLIAFVGVFQLGGDATSTVDIAEDPNDVPVPFESEGAIDGQELEYVGSFAAPETEPGQADQDSFGFGGFSMAFNPDGGTEGEGSLFIAGFNRNEMIGEISIPTPLPHNGSRTGLVTAEVLQPLTDITEGRASSLVALPTESGSETEFRIGGLDVVDLGEGPRLHWTTYQSINVVSNNPPGHGHSSLDLSNPDVQGPWGLEGFTSSQSPGYLFDVPEEFAQDALDGHRFLSGFQASDRRSTMSQGPPFFGFTPSASAELGTELAATEIVNYALPAVVESFEFTATAPSAEWLSTADGRNAVAVFGNQVRVDINQDCRLGEENDISRNGPFVALYDPDTLAMAAEGTIGPADVEPYELLALDEFLIPVCGVQLGGASFDEANNRLFVAQVFATTSSTGNFDARPVIHVFNVG